MIYRVRLSALALVRTEKVVSAQSEDEAKNMALEAALDDDEWVLAGIEDNTTQYDSIEDIS